MPRSYNRFIILLGALFSLLLAMSLLYMLGMYYLEGKPRDFMQALQWAAGTASTTGYGGDTTWQHPVMVVYVVCAQFIGVIMLFLVLPIYLIPFLEERFETKLPKESANAKNHVVIFDYGPAVATLITELKQTNIPTVIIDEDEDDARHLLEQGHQVIYGNLDEGVLGKANLSEARALIVNSCDDRNAATILAARQLGVKGEILALVEDPYHRQPIILAGASSAYTPRHVLGAALAARASRKVSPTVAGIQHLGHKLQVAEARITRDSPLAGKTLAEAALDQHPGPGVNLVGNVLDTQILKQAGLDNAQAVILALSADAPTLFSTVIIKDLAPDVPVIARVNSVENVERIYAAGADFALSISQVSGQLLAWRLLGKESIEVDPELRVIKVSTRGLENHHPKQPDLGEKTGCTVVAVERGEELLVEFGGDFKFAADDAVYTCGSADAAQKFFQSFPQDE